MLIRRALAVFAVVLTTVRLPAQDRPRSDSLPRDLVIALLGGSLGGRNVDVRAGLADDSLPADLFRDALLLGFADYRLSRTTVAYFPYAPQATIDTIKARMVQTGWTTSAEEPDTVRGFVDAFGGTRPQALCRNSAVVVPTVVVRSLNRTLAVISRSNEGSTFMCGGREAMMREARGRSVMNPAANTPLPALPPPAGMRSRGGGTSGVASRDRGMTMDTNLEGSLPFPDIVAHYTALFTKAGWTRIEERLATAIGVVTFETTANGVSWHCALIVNVPSPAVADIHLVLRTR